MIVISIAHYMGTGPDIAVFFVTFDYFGGLFFFLVLY